MAPRLKTLLLAAGALVLLHAPAGASAAGTLDQRRLQVEQQQDALRLDLQQSMRARSHGISPADAHRLNQLQLQQRVEQQQLEIQQTQRAHALRRLPGPSDDAVERRLEMQRDLFATERQLQIQRFELDQQRLLQSARPQPLQPPIGSPQLTLP
jgi:hypothetical protein